MFLPVTVPKGKQEFASNMQEILLNDKAEAYYIVAKEADSVLFSSTGWPKKSEIFQAGTAFSVS